MNQRKLNLIFASLATLAAVTLLGQRPALAQVVADAACPKYAVDIAAFATCDVDHVAGNQLDLRFVTPVEAYAQKMQWGTGVLLIDVRDRGAVRNTGIEAGVDAVVPWAEVAQPLDWDTERANPRLAVDPDFTALMQAWVGALDGDKHTPLLLLCSDGTRAQMAAMALQDAGFDHVSVVAGGIYGHTNVDGTRIGGWKDAGLPWLAEVDPVLLYGTSD